MNASMLFASAADQVQRYDATKRRHAERAYDRQAEYNGRHQKTVADLEALLTGKAEHLDRRDFTKLGAGQVKQVAIPVGKTLEETIDVWRDVRREAIASTDPTTADYQLAATASAKIMDTEARLALQKREQSQQVAEANRAKAETFKVASMDLPTDLERELLLEQKRFAKAISAYAIQMEAKQNRFMTAWPSFSRSA
ncbi:hypothetical protein QT711_12205 [Sporosarcina saromensis]|uniref:Uncharacterized protein n=1 Tax=Sporosarcina saromensis TaxID=359365 RepID=A0ABU4GAF2_9BACL|nr:hypothetical protein [Sporosarcina saromensis]MDW0113952.1 hypothetical protein [Sporosarcina saromensis]